MMHYSCTLSKILLVFLVSSLYLQYPTILVVEARNYLVSSNNVFKIDLIHRNSPLSPYYDTSITPQERFERSPLGSISHGHKIRLSSKYYYDIGVPSNMAERSDLIPNGGDYLIKITLGTPKVEFLANADTGSDLIWVQCMCENSTTCIPQKSPSFDPNKSSTFDVIQCPSSTCQSSDLKTQCASDSSKTTPSRKNNNNNDSSLCAYEVLYGDNTQSIGVLAKDTLSLPSSDQTTSLSLPSSVFGCGLIQQGNLGRQGEGIVGLGRGPSSLISQLAKQIDNTFTFCLAPLSSEANSKLTFGANVMDPGAVSTPIKNGPRPIFYYLTLDSISVEGKDKPAQVPVGTDIVIDSGTTLTYLPTSVYDGVKAALTSAIEQSPIPSPSTAYDLCYNTGSGGQLNPPDVVFHFQGADVVLKAINTFRDIGNGVTCLALVAAEKDFIFGNIAQVNFQIEYDLNAKQVSFAPADCSTIS